MPSHFTIPRDIRNCPTTHMKSLTLVLRCTGGSTSDPCYTIRGTGNFQGVFDALRIVGICFAVLLGVGVLVGVVAGIAWCVTEVRWWVDNEGVEWGSHVVCSNIYICDLDISELKSEGKNRSLESSWRMCWWNVLRTTCSVLRAQKANTPEFSL